MSRRRTERLCRLTALLLAVAATPAVAQSQAASDVQPPTPSHSRAPATPAPTAPAPASTTGDSRAATRAALSAPNLTQLRPTGAVTVTADHAELVEGNYAVYTGKVEVKSDTLTMHGDRLELRQTSAGQYTAKITGNPATLNHQSTGVEDPAVTARAQTLNYDSKTTTVKLSGQAQLTRGGNVVDGEEITYDLTQHRVQAVGGDGGQVKMVIQPPPADSHGGQTTTPPASGSSR